MLFYAILYDRCSLQRVEIVERISDKQPSFGNLQANFRDLSDPNMNNGAYRNSESASLKKNLLGHLGS
jgi:hypothetical protein